jgi:hypothetical protein
MRFAHFPPHLLHFLRGEAARVPDASGRRR